MTRTSRRPARGPLGRRAAGATSLVCGLPLAAVASVAAAGPASAAPPEGWEDAPAIDTGFLLGVMIGVPVLVFLVILGFVYVPALIRGERVAPGAPPLEDQWLGGPSRPAGELTAPDTAPSRAGGDAPAELESGARGTGGAGGRW